MLRVNCLFEGRSDRAVTERLLAAVDAHLGIDVETGGKADLDSKIPGICRSANPFLPWFVLRDLDHDDENGCCGPLLTKLHDGVPPSDHLVIRFAVRTVESWLLADCDGFARFFKVEPSRLPANPDSLADPKRALADVCRRSKAKEIREGVPPRPGSGRSVGPRYGEFISNYSRTSWNPAKARQISPSLDRALNRLEQAVGWWRTESNGG